MMDSGMGAVLAQSDAGIGVLALVRHESGKAQRQRRDGYLD